MTAGGLKNAVRTVADNDCDKIIADESGGRSEAIWDDQPMAFGWSPETVRKPLGVHRSLILNDIELS